MSVAAALVRTNLLEVFNERDPEKRAAAIARLDAPGVVFTAEGRITRLTTMLLPEG